MNRDEIFDNVRDVLVDALAVDEDEVKPEATIFGDLGAESIDVLDISFKLEQAFDFKIGQGELFPEGAMQDPELVQEGKVTDKGLVELKQKMPHIDFSVLQDDPRIERVQEVFTVDALVNFVDRKVNS